MWFGRRDVLDDAHGRRWPNVLVWVLLLFFSFRQQPGETTFDTKLDLTVSPGSFLDRTLNAWNPLSSFGELGNQAYGYLFPQGAFFVLGEVLGLPEWVVQRLWSGLLLVVAFEGARLLFAAIDQPRRRPWLPLVAGLAYALSPRLLGLSGVLTGEIHPSAVLPWVVLPLVLALRGELTALHGAAWSGVAVLMMGGVNATEILLALPVPGFVILCSMGHRQGRRLALWWPVAVLMATLWWLFGLFTQGRYSPPFLDYIETAATTTRPLGWANVTRGSDHWLSFLWSNGQPWWPGSHQLATDPWLVAMSGLVAGISLIGLFHRNMPFRLPLALSALTGVVLLTLGHVVELGSPLSGSFQTLLDGALSPFRNIHKLDPVVRLPLALGFAHAVGFLGTRLKARLEESLLPGRAVRPVVVVAGIMLLLASAQPLFTGDLRKPGWQEIPRAWYEAADYLGRNSDGGRAIVLPGSGFGQQTWGWTIDEPLQALASAPWVSRSQVPLAPGQTVRYLDAIEERIQDGVGSPVLADALARAGVKHVLVRRDLDLWATESPTPARVDLALSRSPGLEKVASFGTAVFGAQSMIDIFEVQRNVPLLEAVDISSVKTLAGGPEDTMTAMEAGLLNPGEVTVNASEPGWDKRPDVVGDGFRRRERQFGRLVDPVSQVMTADEPYRTKRGAHDYPAVSEDDRVVARYTSLSAVTASSSSGYVDSVGAIQPEMGPYAAVDGTEDTYWRSAPLEDPVGQWLQVGFEEPQALDTLRVVVGTDDTTGVPVRRIRVQVGTKAYDRVVDPATGEAVIPLDGAAVDEVRITVTDVFGDPQYGVVSIREVSFGGVEIERTLVLPDNGATGETSFVFRARPHRRACVDVGFGPQCDENSGRASEEEHGLNRVFETSTGGRYQIRAQVVARSTRASGDLLHPFPGRLQSTASSVLADDPSVSGQRAVDDNPATSWIAARGAESPSLRLVWGTPRTISRLTYAPGVPDSSTPTTAVIEAGGERRVVDLRAGALGYFKPLRAEEAEVTFPVAKSRLRGQDPPPLALGELELEGLEGLKVGWNPTQETGAPCGYGPDVALDGTRYPTRVRGTLGDVTSGDTLDLELCGRRTVTIGAGSHDLSVSSTDRFAVTALTMAPTGGTPVAEEPRGREVAITSWSASQREVQVGAGSESVLRVPENVNLGWEARLGGQELEPLRLDGWQQGFLLPEGEGGTVELQFVPDRNYRTLLAIGALSALLLLSVAILLELRRGRTGARTAAVSRARPPRWLGQMGTPAFVGLSVLGYVAGGVPMLLGVLGGILLRQRRDLVLLLPGAMVGAAAAAQAVSAWRGDGVFVTWADWLAGAAVGFLLFALVRPATEEVPR